VQLYGQELTDSGRVTERDWPEIIAEILAVAGLLVTAHDDEDERQCNDHIEALRILLVAWHSPRDRIVTEARYGWDRGSREGRFLFLRPDGGRA
jgi:hypothetical protein